MQKQGHLDESGEGGTEKSWLQKALIGRTPSLPSSLGKRKQSFLKKLQSRKISAPSFALRSNPPSSSSTKSSADGEDKVHGSSTFTIGSGHSSSCSSINVSTTPDTRRRPTPAAATFRQDTTSRSHSPATPPIDGNAWFLPSDTKQQQVPIRPINFENLDEAGAFVEELREKYRLQGSQLVLYKKKLRQQKNELSNLRLMQKQQLEEITAQLILFESCLLKKEKQLEETLHMKNQVILKQQRVIKHLIKKDQLHRGSEGLCESPPGITPSSFSGSGSDVTQSEPIMNLRRLSAGTLILHSSSGPSGENNETIFRSDPEFDLQNDSDSAILSEDQTVTEVSLSVPNLLTTTKLNSCVDSSGNNHSSSPLTIITDDFNTPRKKEDRGRKTKEERRISNRQKLLSLKRHSGFLKRPEILETVYSVEEDAEKQTETNSAPVKTPSEENPATETNKDDGEKVLPPATVDTSLSNSAAGKSSRTLFLLQRCAFRSRFDSDLNISDPDLSTDEDRLVFSETDASASCCTCSRRNSFCYCSSRAGSRRSSYGSHANLILSQGDDDRTLFYNRVMTNHKSVLKPRDIKFKRINKSKSKSLEELRGKLRSQILERASLEKEVANTNAMHQQLSGKGGGIRGIFKQSISLDHGS